MNMDLLLLLRKFERGDYMKIIDCDECSKKFVLDIKTEKLENCVERIYFTCSHCGREYTSHYLNALIKKKQEKIKQIQQKYNNVRGKDIKQASSFYKQYEKLKKEIGRDMESLRIRVEKSSK